MKLSCDIVQDLLPLYTDGVCSGDSRRAVEAHLEGCPACRAAAGVQELPPMEPTEAPRADQAVAKSIKRVRCRWLTSLAAMVLIVPLLLLSWNQYRGTGLCFTNMDDTFTAWRFLHALETGDWETAAKMHDYSRDYESILDALERPVSNWDVSFTPFELENTPFMASAWLSRYGCIPDTVEALYEFLYNRTGNAMIPLTLWEQVIAVEPEAVWQEGWQYWLGEELYSRITTPWGEFVVTDGRGYDTAYEYCQYFDLVPAVIYEEAEAAIKANAQQVFNETHASYDYVAQMTEEEFIQYMTESYAADLAETEAMEVSFDCTSYRSAYAVGEGDWHIQFGLDITYQGETLETTVAIGIYDGKVSMVGLSYFQPVEWLHTLENILYPSAHPGY